MSTVPGPVFGPCSSWIDGADVLACCDAASGTDPEVFDQVAVDASVLLFEISGRQFTGLCEDVVRPCRDSCGCWPQPSSGVSPWLWTAGGFGYGGGLGWWWWNECGERCGCGSLSTVRLAGYPVREIVQVKIGGVVLDALDTNGNPNYRLDGWRNLVRMDDPSTDPATPRRWPGCQNLALDSSQPGTFEVTYRHGIDPPEVGRSAAAQLACELYRACNGQACQLPSNVVKIQRQGVTVDRNVILAFLDPKKPSGMAAVDLFLAMPGIRRTRRSAVWSPDVQPFAKRLGS